MLSKTDIQSWRAIFKELYAVAQEQDIKFSMFLNEYYSANNGLCLFILFPDIKDDDNIRRSMAICSADNDENITSFYNDIINYYKIIL